MALARLRPQVPLPAVLVEELKTEDEETGPQGENAMTTETETGTGTEGIAAETATGRGRKIGEGIGGIAAAPVTGVIHAEIPGGVGLETGGDK
jgi:hypothetical protein